MPKIIIIKTKEKPRKEHSFWIEAIDVLVVVVVVVVVLVVGVVFGVEVVVTGNSSFSLIQS